MALVLWEGGATSRRCRVTTTHADRPPAAKQDISPDEKSSKARKGVRSQSATASHAYRPALRARASV
jgi:hypothetical protein